MDGTTTQSELDISSVPFPQRKGYAHSFAYGATRQSHLLNIGQIIVNSGVISAINGYHTADLSGPLTIAPPPLPTEPGSTPQAQTQTVDRISFDALLPGASINIGGDLNTLDVLNGVDLNSGPGIDIGRDLNLINVGQDLDLSNGASLIVDRFLGTTPQPPKGTATGSNFLALNQALVGTGTSTIVPSLSGYIQGNMNLGTRQRLQGGQRDLQRYDHRRLRPAPSVFLVNGSVTASSSTHVTVHRAGHPRSSTLPSTTFTATILNPAPPPATLSVPANFIARAGFNIPASLPLIADETRLLENDNP